MHIRRGKIFRTRVRRLHSSALHFNNLLSFFRSFIPKTSSNKGERKQDTWLGQVQSAIDALKQSNQADGPLLRLLVRLRDMANVPRKEKKFMNFMRNSFRGHQPELLEKAWKSIQTEITANSASPTQNGEAVTEECKAKVSIEKDEAVLNRKERKALRQQKQTKREKKDLKENFEELAVETTKSSKKKRKKMLKSTVENEEIQDDNAKMEKKSRKRKSLSADVAALDVQEENDSSPPVKKVRVRAEKQLNDINSGDVAAKPAKFDWCDTAARLLSARGAQLSLKRLHKAMLRAYAEHRASNGADFAKQPKDDVKMITKLNRKLARDSRFLLSHDRVHLRLLE